MAAATTTGNLLPISIDMSTFSHSELHSLSLLSQHDLLFATAPTIDTSSSFNQSATSLHQTYSTTTHRIRHHSSTATEPERSESASIINFMNRRLNPNGAAVEITNSNGAVVDVAALEEREGGGVYDDELRRRVAGIEEEEEAVVKAVEEIEGKWCSVWRKRRVVDASFLSDALPVGWKILVAIRRRAGRFSPYCRRFISPTGEHFSSCKEVSSYLKSYFGINDPKLLRDSQGDLQQLQHVNSTNDTLVLDVSYETPSNTYLRIEQGKDVSVSGIDTLPDVQVCDLYECHTCKISFNVKDNYLQHVLSTHERTTKRYKFSSSIGDPVAVRDGNYECQACNITFDERSKYVEHVQSTHKSKKKRRRLSPSVTDGVIMRDGKYECQFCDKVFEEKRRYIGHVGNHVKGVIKITKDSALQVPGTENTPSVDRFATKINNSKMDALVEIAQNSFRDIFPTVHDKEPSCVANFNQLCMAIDGSTKNADFFPETNLEKCDRVEKALSSSLKPCTNVSRTSNDGTGKDNGKDKTPSKKSLSRLNKASKILMKDRGINELEKHGAQTKTKTTTCKKVLYPRDKMKEKSMTNGDTNGLASRPTGLDVEKYGPEQKTSSKLKTHAHVSVPSVADGELKEQVLARKKVEPERKSCFDAIMMPAAETGIQTDNSTVNWVGSTEDGASVEESAGFKVSLISYNQKPSHVESAEKIIQSKCMDDDSDLTTVAGDAPAFGCTDPQTLLNSSSPFDEIFEKAGQNICNLDLNLESGNGFEYMKLDATEPQMYKYNAMNGDDSIFLPEVSMDLEKHTGFNIGFNASTNSQTNFPETIPNRSITTMTCVWCCLEFVNEVLEMELQPDSVGFMCPACRGKISKQFNELESNFAMDFHYS